MADGGGAIGNAGNNQGSGNGGAIATGGRSVIVKDSVFSGNSCPGTGGAIGNFDGFNYTKNRVTLSWLTIGGSTFAGNGVGEGGAVYNEGRLKVANSTFSGNTARFGGGGISNDATSGPGPGDQILVYCGRTILANSTLADNSTSGGGTGAAVFNLAQCGGGRVRFENTIIANSTGSTNCSQVFINDGHNLDSDGSCGVGPATDPMLDPAGPADNGGPTQTIALQAGSPAINAGNQFRCRRRPVRNVDQRGYVRPGTGATQCSIGAYEYNSPGCPSPLTACGMMNICTNLQTDANNCGACGTPVQLARAARAGSVASCTPVVGPTPSSHTGAISHRSPCLVPDVRRRHERPTRTL